MEARFGMCPIRFLGKKGLLISIRYVLLIVGLRHYDWNGYFDNNFYIFVQSVMRHTDNCVQSSVDRYQYRYI